MSTEADASADSSAHKIQQAVKWTVYALLIVNFVFYIFEDWNRAVHTLTASSTFLDWASEFATSIDESAWFILLFMFELETYILEDKDWKGWVSRTVHGVRLVCFVMIAHTVYAFADSTINLQPTVPVENVSHLCDMANDNVSYVYNLEYTEVNAQSCNSISEATQFYWVGVDPIVSDRAGLQLERYLTWADLAEVIIWLVILLAIETVVRLQGRGVTDSPLITVAHRLKLVLYASLLLLGVYWASLSHWLYLWDEIVWIGGFAAIEMNVAQWRDDILGERDSPLLQE